MLVFIEKQSSRIALYGSIEALINNEGDIVGKDTQFFYRKKKGSKEKVFDLKLQDFENEFCRICKKEVVREEQKNKSSSNCH